MKRLPGLYGSVKITIVAFWFIVCVLIVKPSIGTALMPMLSDLKASRKEVPTDYGIDLEPLIVDDSPLLTEGQSDKGKVAGVTSPSPVEIGSDVPNSMVLSTNVKSKDLRAIAMDTFLEKKKSPIAGYGEKIVNAADEYGIDWRVVIAVATIESGPCRVTPKDSFNCWGWKSGPGEYMKFSSWDHSIAYITQRFGEAYGEDFDPMRIESSYCPPCAEGGEHKWANGVNGYMTEMDWILQGL